MDALQLTNNGTGVRLSCTSTSSRGAIVGNGDILVVTNIGAKVAYLALGSSTVTATTTAYPILPGTKEDILLDVNASYYAAIYAAGIMAGTETTTLLVQRGFR